MENHRFLIEEQVYYLKVTNAFRNGVEAGLVAQLSMSDHWAVQTAVLYAQRGFSFVEKTDVGPNEYSCQGDYSFRFNYLAVPVNVVYSQLPGGEGVQVFAGPYVGFLLGGQYTVTQTGRYGDGTSSSSSRQGDVEAGDTYNGVV